MLTCLPHWLFGIMELGEICNNMSWLSRWIVGMVLLKLEAGLNKEYKIVSGFGSEEKFEEPSELGYPGWKVQKVCCYSDRICLRRPSRLTGQDVYGVRNIQKYKNVDPTQFEESVTQSFFDLENGSTELKSDLKYLYINSAVEVDVFRNRKVVVIHVPPPTKGSTVQHPHSRTLTSVHDAMLEDLVYPAKIEFIP